MEQRKQGGEGIPLGEPILSQERMVRTVRVGAVPVLTAAAEYPALPEEGESPAGGAALFNERMRRIAEAFLAFALQEPAAEAERDYAAAGPGAAYTFPRRELLCNMTMTSAGESGGGSYLLCLTTEVTAGVRRRGERKKVFSDHAYFEYPSMTLAAPPPPVRGKDARKPGKKSRKPAEEVPGE